MTQPTATPDVSATSPAPAPLTATPGLPPVPDDVRKFAEEVGAAPYLPGVLGMARGLCPHAELSVVLLEDPEIEGYRHIAFAIDVTGWTSEQMLDVLDRWSAEIAHYCPATHTPYFTYVLRERR
jgi:hypothetical protein